MSIPVCSRLCVGACHLPPGTATPGGEGACPQRQGVAAPNRKSKVWLLELPILRIFERRYYDFVARAEGAAFNTTAVVLLCTCS